MSRDVSLLHPALQGVVNQLKKEFPSLLITETFRTVAEQDALYAKGRTAPGKIVTYARGSSYSSQHQWGIAFDFANNQAGNLYPSSFMRQVGTRAKQLGCGWGGDWSGFVDTPHVYLPDWGSGTSILKNKYGTFEKFKATWGSTPLSVGGEEELVMILMTVEGNPAVFLVNLTNMSVTPFHNPDELAGIQMVYETATGKQLKWLHFTTAAPWHGRICDFIYREEYKGFVGMWG